MAKKKKKLTTAKKDLSKVPSLAKREQKKLERREKTLEFMEEFIKNGGNITQAGLKVYKDRSPEAAAMAGVRAFEHAKQIGLLRMFAEKQGYDMGRMVELMFEKMEASNDTKWWDRAMKMLGYEDFISTKANTKNSSPVNVNIFSQHDKYVNEYVIDAEEDNEN